MGYIFSQIILIILPYLCLFFVRFYILAFSRPLSEFEPAFFVFFSYCHKNLINLVGVIKLGAKSQIRFNYGVGLVKGGMKRENWLTGLKRNSRVQDPCNAKKKY